MSYPGIESKKKFWVIGAIIVGLLLLYMAFVYESNPTPTGKQTKGTKSTSGGAQRPGDADSIADSLETMVVRMAEQNEKLVALQDELATVKQKQNLSEQDLTQLANNQRETNKALVGEVEQMITSQTRLKPENVNIDKYPINTEEEKEPLGWVETIEEEIYGTEITTVEKGDNSVITSVADALNSFGKEILPDKTIEKVKSVKETVFEDSPLENKNARPVYTIPKNSTIFNSYLATSLVGRLPSNNQLSNPYRFKILTGPEGIASNSIELPEELSAMTFSGTAIGDWGLSCASGKIDSVTFTFNDGEIVTIDGKGSRGIGWISDEHGEPCIRGEKVSDSKSVLTKRILAGAFTSGADTYARAQTETVFTGSGAVVDIEDANKYAGYNAISGGAREVERHLDRRLNQIFEAIYVPNGAKVMIHIEDALEIDRNNKNRKVRYDEKIQVTNLD